MTHPMSALRRRFPPGCRVRLDAAALRAARGRPGRSAKQEAGSRKGSVTGRVVGYGRDPEVLVIAREGAGTWGCFHVRFVERAEDTP
jgi:hypothetical protein